MHEGDEICSGLSLERDVEARKPRIPNRESPEDVLYFIVTIDDKRMQGAVSPEDISYLTGIVRNQDISNHERYLANQLLARCYNVLSDFQRGLYYMKVALTLANTLGERASCDRDIFLFQSLISGNIGAEELRQYEIYAREAEKGILERNESVIELVLRDGPSQSLEDYALLAAASRAWSIHPQNKDAFDREEAEAQYYLYVKKFEQQEKAGFQEEIYQISGAAQWRKALLQGKSAGKTHGDVERGKKTVPERQCDREGTIEVIKQFNKEYPNAGLPGASESCVREYVLLAGTVISAIWSGDVEVMRYVAEDAAPFKAMGDTVILGSAALLWWLSPDKRDVARVLQARLRGIQWLETSLTLVESNDYPLFKKLETMSDMDAPAVKTKWTELLQHVLDELRRY